MAVRKIASTFWFWSSARMTVSDTVATTRKNLQPSWIEQKQNIRREDCHRGDEGAPNRARVRRKIRSDLSATGKEKKVPLITFVSREVPSPGGVRSQPALMALHPTPKAIKSSPPN